ncbi:MAG: DJ-1/PfpI family protein [Puniceicoccales bacterium]|jgi:4-methyl-5(b-hydroxyethyl)-thiazole monophosphate biosynthesis|nr:DJ-1/PfpI family protein [Puniceicoccales bacterium]
MGKRICVLFGDGVEEMEIVVPVDILRRGGLVATLVSASGGLQVDTAHGVRLGAESTVDGVSPDSFDALMVPGGPGSFTLKDDARVLEIVRDFHCADKLLCAICAAPLILHNAGALIGKKFCSHPCAYGVLKDADRDARIVVDSNLITAKGPGVAADFAFTILGTMCGEAVASKLREEMFF